MQHFGVPTRLLDITFSPLVALYFAVHDQEHDDKNGIVYFSETKKPIRHSDDYLLNIKSHISLLTKKEENELREIALDYKKRLVELEDQRDTLREFNKENLIKKLNAISSPNMTGKRLIRPQELLLGSPVQPKLTNERIIAQQGLFVVPGAISDNKYSYKIFNDGIIIGKNSKGNIRNELKYIGINDMTMFPDFPGMAERIKNNI